MGSIKYESRLCEITDQLDLAIDQEMNFLEVIVFNRIKKISRILITNYAVIVMRVVTIGNFERGLGGMFLIPQLDCLKFSYISVLHSNNLKISINQVILYLLLKHRMSLIYQEKDNTE